MNDTPLPLRDIHLPPPPSWWPPPAGWWLLAATLLLLGAGLRVWRKVRARYRLRDAALAEIAAIRSRYAQHGDPRLLAAELSALLRRICLLKHPASQVASLTGPAWLELLEKTTPAYSLAKAGGSPLITAPFEPNPTFDPERLLGACQGWIQALPLPPLAGTSHNLEKPS